MYDVGIREKNNFIIGGHLDVRRVLEKFVEAFDDLYGDKDESFLEDAGRRYFMLFLKPIINGAGIVMWRQRPEIMREWIWSLIIVGNSLLSR